MKRIVLLAAVAAALLGAAAAHAHPLGNFTVNRFARVEVAGHRLYVRYVLDLAEIPTYQARPIDAGAYARRIAAGLHVSLGGRPVTLRPVAHQLAADEPLGDRLGRCVRHRCPPPPSGSTRRLRGQPQRAGRH